MASKRQKVGLPKDISLLTSNLVSFMTNVVPFRMPVYAVRADPVTPSENQAAKTSPMRQTSGFLPRNEAFHRFFNVILATLLIALTAPLMAAIICALTVTQGPTILDRRVRLGRNKITFQMFRFRTADTPVGRFLRGARLDKLPQLMNVLRGDMNMVGPRPVSGSTAIAAQRRDPCFDVRFRVRPGLIGPAQAYLTKETTLRHQTKIDYKLCRGRVYYMDDLALIAGVGLTLVRDVIALFIQPSFSVSAQRKAFNTAQDWHVRLVTPTGHFPINTVHGNRLSCSSAVQSGEATLEITTSAGGLRKARVRLETTNRTFGRQSMAFTAANPTAAHYIARYLHSAAIMKPTKPAPNTAWFDHATGDMIDLSLPQSKRSTQKA